VLRKQLAPASDLARKAAVPELGWLINAGDDVRDGRDKLGLAPEVLCYWLGAEEPKPDWFSQEQRVRDGYARRAVGCV
jgi:hypothetical protein